MADRWARFLGLATVWVAVGGCGGDESEGARGAGGDAAAPLPDASVRGDHDGLDGSEDSADSYRGTNGEVGEPGGGSAEEVSDAEGGADNEAGGRGGGTGGDGRPFEAGVDAADEGPPGDASEAAQEAGCRPNVLSLCNDGNACTVDGVDASCACTHVPLADDSACDDGDPCTVGDRCASGVCTGHAQASTPQILGGLTSFGSESDSMTLVALSGNDRAVFATWPTMTLTRIVGDRLEVLDQTAFGPSYMSDNVSPMVWLDRPRTFILPLKPDLMAVVGTRWGIALYDIGQDRFTAFERLALPNSTFTAAVGDASRIWAVDAGWLRSYAIDLATHRVTEGPSLNLPAGCRVPSRWYQAERRLSALARAA